MILEGIVMPIGRLNANGWGIPPSEVDNTISSLKQSVVRLCSEFDHACDLNESRLHEIGTVIDAWSDGEYIKAKTRISNPKAKSMVNSGDLKAWSVYGQGDQQSDGFVQKYMNKSLTLVADPAWSQAKFKKVAAAKRFMLTNSFSKDVTMTEDSEEKKFLAGLDKKIEESKASMKQEVTDLIASKDKQINDLTEIVKKQTEEFAAFKASIEKMFPAKDEKPKEDAPVYASKDDIEGIKSEMKTDQQINELVAAKIAERDESKSLANVIADYKNFAASRNLKIEDTIFQGKTSAMIETELGILKSLTASVAQPEPLYHSIPDEFADDMNSLTVGIPDGNGGWK